MVRVIIADRPCPDPYRPVTFRATVQANRRIAVPKVFFKSGGPIGDTKIDALPVKEIGPAVGDYMQCLGFTLVSKGKSTARLKRDDVETGLAVNGQDAEQVS
jgi:hypothetical protein